MADKSQITQLLIEVSDGDRSAYDDLFPLVYNELRSIARSQLAREYSANTLSKAELVHEAYMKLVDQTCIDFNDRDHFYAIAARCMRQILVDHARRKKALKRGGGDPHIPLEEAEIDLRRHAGQIVALDELLDRLAERDERIARIVELRFFGGMTVEETARLLNISTSTVDRDWQKARGWLYRRLKSEEP